VETTATVATATSRACSSPSPDGAGGTSAGASLPLAALGTPSGSSRGVEHSAEERDVASRPARIAAEEHAPRLLPEIERRAEPMRGVEVDPDEGGIVLRSF
jgi:hypothetical protein